MRRRSAKRSPPEHALRAAEDARAAGGTCQHRIRQGFIEERTACLNRIRGVLAEFGQVLPQRASELRRGRGARAAARARGAQR